MDGSVFLLPSTLTIRSQIDREYVEWVHLSDGRVFRGSVALVGDDEWHDYPVTWEPSSREAMSRALGE